MSKKCNYINSDGVISEFHTELYDYIFQSPSVNIEEVERILRKYKLFSTKRDRSGKLRTYLTMGKDVNQQVKTASGVNTRIKETLSISDNLIKYTKLNRVYSKFNPQGNDVYSAWVDPSAVSKINSIKKTMDTAESQENDSMSEDEFWGFKKNALQANEHIIPLEQRGAGVQARLSEVEQKIGLIKSLLPVNVVIDGDVPYSRVDPFKPGELPTIRLNPKKIFKDTVIHEFMHIYVDLLGGTDNVFIADGVEQLRDSKAWKHVLNNYPHIKEDSEEFHKEVLATAAGWKSVELEAMPKFKRWLVTFFDKLRELLGLPTDNLRILVNEVLKGKIRTEHLNGQLSPYIQEQRESTREEEILDKAKNVLIKKIAMFSKNAERETNKEAQKNKKENVAKLQDLLRALSEVETNIGLVRFVNNAEASLRNIHARLLKIDESAIEAGEIRILHKYASSYKDVLSEVNGIVDEDSDLKETLIANKGLGKLRKSLELIDKIDSRYNKLKHIYTASRVVTGRAAYSMEQEWVKEFKKENPKAPKETTEAYNNRIEAYVRNKAAANKAEIQEREKKYTEGLLKRSPRDIGYSDMWLVDPASINDDLIKYVVEVIDRADFNTARRFNEELANADEIFNKLKSLKGGMGVVTSDTKSFYNELIEDEVDEFGKKTGNKTSNYVSKYYSDFYKHRRALANEVDWELPVNERIKTEEFRNFKKWMADNTTAIEIDGVYKSVPNKKWENPQFENINNLRKQGSAIAEAYDYLIALNKLKDANLPEAARLGYKLPRITKSFLERTGTNGVVDALKDRLGDIAFLRPEDTEFGSSVLADEEGKERQNVPIFYRNKIKPEDQSFDLFSIALLDFKMSENFKNKSMIQADVDVIKEIVAERKYTKRQGIVAKIDALLSRDKNKNPVELTVEGQSSNTLKALESLIETRMYNIKSVGSVSSHKVTNAILGWNGGVALALNYFSATTNVIQGKLMNWMEASARYNNLYTRKNLKTAEKLYWGDIKSNTADWFKTDKKSTTSQLNKKFNVEESYSLENTFVEDNILKKRFNLGTTSQAQESGEHYIQNTLMYAVLDNIKCKNANGDYIDKDGNVVDQESALSLAYAYTLKDGKLELNPHVSSTDKGEIGEELDFTVGRLIRKTMRDLHGNYSKENIALAQRYAAGKLGFFLRKWMVRGYKKRLRGVATSLTSVEDIPEELRYFSKETEEYEEGTYTTAIRFLADVKRRFKEEKFKALSANWADLSDYEKANIMKTVKELSLITGAYIASQVLAGLAKDADDEDDKYWLYMGAFLARRTYSELSFYLNPRETIRIVKSPTATVTLIDDMLDVLDRINPLNYLSEDYNLDDRYERGKRKGKFKIVKELEDVVPILKQFDKTPEDSYNWLLK